jgi:hypothetical protein
MAPKSAQEIAPQNTPIGPITIIFEDDGDAAVFELIWKVIQMKTTMLESVQNGTILRHDVRYDPEFWKTPFSLPWNLPEWLSTIFNGSNHNSESCIRYESQIQDYDATRTVDRALLWSLEGWRTEWRYIT